MKNHKKGNCLSRIIVGIIYLEVILLVPWVINNSAVIGASAVKIELPIYCVEGYDKVVS